MNLVIIKYIYHKMGSLFLRNTSIINTQYVNLLIYKYILIFNLTPVKNTGVGSHSLFQDIFPTQGSNTF